MNVFLTYRFDNLENISAFTFLKCNPFLSGVSKKELGSRMGEVNVREHGSEQDWKHIPQLHVY